jgi:hypothetical protein
MHTSEVLAYMAGLVDGEGSVSIFKGKVKTKLGYRCEELATEIQKLNKTGAGNALVN